MDNLSLMDWVDFSHYEFPSFSHQLRTFVTNGTDSIFRTFVTNFRTFVTVLRTFVTNLRTFVTNSEIPPRYLYYIQRNFEGLGETENKDYKITYKIIIKYQILFFEFFDYFLRVNRYSLDVPIQ